MCLGLLNSFLTSMKTTDAPSKKEVNKMTIAINNTNLDA